jgi:SAM-dependent methyltransferase
VIFGLRGALPPGLGGIVEQVSARLSRLTPPPLALLAIARLQAQAAEASLLEHEARIAAVRTALGKKLTAAREGEELQRLASLAEELVTEMRVRMAAMSDLPRWLEIAARLDAELFEDREELMDDASFGEEERLALMRTLDRHTQRAGGYVHFFEAMRPLLGAAAARTTVLDLASGHGGFPIALGRLAADWPKLRIIASDLRPEYVKLARQEIEAQGLKKSVEARVLDAFELARFEPSTPIDVITCTQSLHHFRPGGVAMLLYQAVRRARRGVLFVDLARSLSRLLMIGADAASTLDRAYLHDAVASVRRSFVAPELELIARLVPGAEQVRAFYLPPAFVALRTEGKAEERRRVPRSR